MFREILFLKRSIIHDCQKLDPIFPINSVSVTCAVLENNPLSLNLISSEDISLQ